MFSLQHIARHLPIAITLLAMALPSHAQNLTLENKSLENKLEAPKNQGLNQNYPTLPAKAITGDASDKGITEITLRDNYALEESSLTPEESRQGYEYPELCDCDFISTIEPVMNVLLGLFKIESDPLEEVVEAAAPPVPGLSLQYDNTYGATPYEAQTTALKSNSFTLGSRLTLFKGSSQRGSTELGTTELNAALFNTNVKNLQTTQFDDTVSHNPAKINRARIQGLGLDGRWRALETLTLRGGLAYFDFEQDNSASSECLLNNESDGLTASGLCNGTREYVPEIQANISADYVRSVSNYMELRVVLDVVHSDDRFAPATPDPELNQSAYTKINLRVSLTSTDGNWDLALVGRNLTDEESISFGDQLSLPDSLTRGAGSSHYQFFDRPSTVALQGIYRF